MNTVRFQNITMHYSSSNRFFRYKCSSCHKQRQSSDILCARKQLCRKCNRFKPEHGQLTIDRKA